MFCAAVDTSALCNPAHSSEVNATPAEAANTAFAISTAANDYVTFGTAAGLGAYQFYIGNVGYKAIGLLARLSTTTGSGGVVWGSHRYPKDGVKMMVVPLMPIISWGSMPQINWQLILKTSTNGLNHPLLRASEQYQLAVHGTIRCSHI